MMKTRHRFLAPFTELKDVATLSMCVLSKQHVNTKFASAPTSLVDAPPPPQIKKAINLAIDLNLFLRKQMAVPIEIKQTGIAHRIQKTQETGLRAPVGAHT